MAYNVYKVAAGDDLAKIARLYHTTVEALIRLNGIVDPNHISEGTDLVVPDNSAHEAVVNASKEAQAKSIAASLQKVIAPDKAEPAPAYKTIKYKVVPGDDLAKIAKQHHTTIESLIRLNGILDQNHIDVGTELVIPDHTVRDALTKAAEDAQAKSIAEAQEKAIAQAKAIDAAKAAAADKVKKKACLNAEKAEETK